MAYSRIIDFHDYKESLSEGTLRKVLQPHRVHFRRPILGDSVSVRKIKITPTTEEVSYKVSQDSVLVRRLAGDLGALARGSFSQDQLKHLSEWVYSRHLCFFRKGVNLERWGVDLPKEDFLRYLNDPRFYGETLTFTNGLLEMTLMFGGGNFVSIEGLSDMNPGTLADITNDVVGTKLLESEVREFVFPKGKRKGESLSGERELKLDPKESFHNILGDYSNGFVEFMKGKGIKLNRKNTTEIFGTYFVRTLLSNE